MPAGEPFRRFRRQRGGGIYDNTGNHHLDEGIYDNTATTTTEAPVTTTEPAPTTTTMQGGAEETTTTLAEKSPGVVGQVIAFSVENPSVVAAFIVVAAAACIGYSIYRKKGGKTKNA